MMASTSRLPKFQGNKIPPTKIAVAKNENSLPNRPKKSQDNSKKNADELINRKIEAELTCKTLDDNLNVYQQRCLNLTKQKKEYEVALREKVQKTAILRARSSLSKDQAAVCQDLKEKAEKINEKLSCRLTDEVNSPEQSFVFNPAAKQLECSIKSSIKTCLESDDQSQALALEAVKNYSCEERLKAVMELQNELKNDTLKQVNSVNLRQDADRLSQELKKLDIGDLALQPLDVHIKEFAVKHARSVLDEQNLIHENKKLERQLDELLKNNPELTLEIKAMVEVEQAEVLERNLQQLKVDNHHSSNTEFEQEKALKKIMTLQKNLEDLRHAVMKGLGMLDHISHHQQKLLDEMQSVGKSCNEFDKILEIENHVSTLVKRFYLSPLSSIYFDNQRDDGNTICLRMPDIKAHIQQLNMQLNHQQDTSKVLAEAFRQLKADASKAKEVILRGATEIQHTVCTAQNLYLDHSNAPRDFEEKLATWKETPVEMKLADNLERNVNSFNLQEWVEIFKENYPELNTMPNQE